MNDSLMPEGYGWVKPPSAKKYHYFEKKFSLCGRYGFMFAHGDKDTGNYSDEDCAKCTKELKKRTKSEEK